MQLALIFALLGWALTLLGLVVVLINKCPNEEEYLQKWADARTEGYYEGRADERGRWESKKRMEEQKL